MPPRSSTVTSDTLATGTPGEPSLAPMNMLMRLLPMTALSGALNVTRKDSVPSEPLSLTIR